MAKKINEAAAIHFALGVLQEQEVPVGEHRLAGTRVLITCPDDALVVRGAGKDGDGYEEFTLGKISAAALARYIRDYCKAPSGSDAIAAYTECARETVGKKPDEFLQPEAQAALAMLKAGDLKGRRKTAAKRHGVDRALLSVTCSSSTARKPAGVTKPTIMPNSAKSAAG